MKIPGFLNVVWLTLLVVLIPFNTVMAQPSGAPLINIVTTEFPPYSFEQYDRPAGMATEIVLATLQRSGIAHATPLIQPWARAYQSALHKDNTLIYSIARSSEREPLFHWIGKVAPYSIYLYKLRNRRDIQVANLEEAKRYLVGGEYEDIKQDYLKQRGFKEGKNLQLAADDAINLRKLFAGRIDLLPFNEISLPYMLKQEDLPVDALEPVLFLDEISYDLYMALSRNSDTRAIAALRKALRSLEADGTLAAIQQAYMGARIANHPAP